MLCTEEDTLMFEKDSDEKIILVIARQGSKLRRSEPFPVAHGAIADGIEFEELFSQ